MSMANILKYFITSKHEDKNMIRYDKIFDLFQFPISVRQFGEKNKFRLSIHWGGGGGCSTAMSLFSQ